MAAGRDRDKGRKAEATTQARGRLGDQTDQIAEPVRRRRALRPSEKLELPVLRQSDYQLGRELGHGGMGTVSTALDLRLGRDVAIKELLEPNAELEERFVREMLITARLQHPGIITIYEAGRRDDGRLVYTMRRYDGLSLREKLDETTTLRERVEYVVRLVDVANAITYAHANGVIHRDIKPSNVVLGEFGETIVIDWGVAKLTTEVSPQMRPEHGREGIEIADEVTTHGAIIGTPGYMSPEQAAGRSVTPATDVYALGACLVDLLCGVQSHEVRSLATFPDEAPAELVAVCNSAMREEPDERISAAEFAEELRRFLSGAMLGSYRYSLLERAQRFVRRHRFAIAFALVFAVTVALFSIRSWRESVATDRAVEASLQRRDQVALSIARSALHRDPVFALDQLAGLSDNEAVWRAARVLAADAKKRGLRRWLATVKGARDLRWSSKGEIISTAAQRVFRIDPDSGSVESARLPEHRFRIDAQTWATLDGASIFLSRPLDGEKTLLTTFATRPTAVAASKDGGVAAALVGDRIITWTKARPSERTRRPAAATMILVTNSGGHLVYDSGPARLAIVDLSSMKERPFQLDGKLLSLRVDGDEVLAETELGSQVRLNLNAALVVGAAREAKLGIEQVHGIARAYITKQDSLVISETRLAANGRSFRVAGASSLATAKDAPLVVAGSSLGTLTAASLAASSYHVAVGDPIAAVLVSDSGDTVFALTTRGQIWSFDMTEIVGVSNRISLAGPAMPERSFAAIAAGTGRVVLLAGRAIVEADLKGGAPRHLLRLEDSEQLSAIGGGEGNLAFAVSGETSGALYLSDQSGAAKLAHRAERPISTISEGRRKADEPSDLLFATDDGQVWRLNSAAETVDRIGAPLPGISELQSRSGIAVALADRKLFVMHSGRWRPIRNGVSAFAIIAGRKLLVASGPVVTEIAIDLRSEDVLVEERLLAMLLAAPNKLNVVFNGEAVVAIADRDARLLDLHSGESRSLFSLDHPIAAVAELPSRGLMATDGLVIVRGTDDLPFETERLRHWIRQRQAAAYPADRPSRP